MFFYLGFMHEKIFFFLSLSLSLSLSFCELRNTNAADWLNIRIDYTTPAKKSMESIKWKYCF